MLSRQVIARVIKASVPVVLSSVSWFKITHVIEASYYRVIKASVAVLLSSVSWFKITHVIEASYYRVIEASVHRVSLWRSPAFFRIVPLQLPVQPRE